MPYLVNVDVARITCRPWNVGQSSRIQSIPFLRSRHHGNTTLKIDRIPERSDENTRVVLGAEGCDTGLDVSIILEFV